MTVRNVNEGGEIDVAGKYLKIEDFPVIYIMIAIIERRFRWITNWSKL